MSASLLATLDDEHAFHTSGRYDLLASEHIPFAALGAEDVDGALRTAIAAEEGVICVLGSSGAGKSSLIGSVTERLPARYVPLRIPVAAATDAFATLGTFSRHALERLAQVDLEPLKRRHMRAIGRALADERTETRGRKVDVVAEVRGGAPPFTAKLGGAFQLQASEELKYTGTDQAALKALQQTLDVLTSARLFPVLVVEDTDHWAATPAVASAFFDQVVRALSKGSAMDAVTVVAVQPGHQASAGYAAVRELLSLELPIPALPDPVTGLRVILDARIDGANARAGARDVFRPRALELLGKAYSQDHSLRRTLSVARAALHQAVSDEASHIEPGHVQHGMAQYPSTAPTP